MVISCRTGEPTHLPDQALLKRSHEADLSATGALHGGRVAARDGGWQSKDDSCRIMTRQQVADLLQVRPRQLERLGIPVLDLGHKTKRYVANDVVAWIDAQRRLDRNAA